MGYKQIGANLRGRPAGQNSWYRRELAADSFVTSGGIRVNQQRNESRTAWICFVEGFGKQGPLSVTDGF